jgi:hypothetical protein
MSDFMLDQYEEYLEDFQAWGREFFRKPLTYGKFERLMVELEAIDIDEECGQLTKELRARRDEIQRLLLTHASYFADGPRITIPLRKE